MMDVKHPANLLTVAALCGTISAQAEDCWDLINGLPAGLTMQCAGCSYFSADFLFLMETELFETRGGLFAATANGLDMFTAADPRPASVLAPFSSATNMTSTQDGGGITRIDISHRGEVSLAPRDIYFQTTYLDCQSRVVFTPQKVGGAPGVAVPVTLSLDFTVLLEDDLPGVGTKGISSSRAEIDLEAPGFFPTEFEGVVVFDRDTDSVPVFSGDFDGLATAVPEGDGFRITAQFEVTVDLLPGEEVHLDATSAATLSSEEYGPGVSEGWSASTPEAIVYTISSSDPAVRFELGTDDPNQPEIIEWQQLSKDGDSTRFQIAWTSIADRTYRLESSPDMQSPWTAVPGREGIASQGSLTTSQVVFNTRNHPHKFYRVVSE